MIGIRTASIQPDRRRVMAKTQQAKQQQIQQHQIQQQQPLHQYKVDFTSILRIRPLHKSKEAQDYVILEKTQQNNVAVAIMHPLVHLTSPHGSAAGGGGSPNFIKEGKAQDFHFNKIFDTSASQESLFYSMGLSMATTAMEPLKTATGHAETAVVVAMGNADSGKSHTIFGKVSKSQEGLVPRILESFFSQSKHHVSSNKTFGVRMTMLLVEKDEVVRDLLVEQPKAQGASSKASSVMAMVASFEKPDPLKPASSGKSEGVAIEQDPITNDFVVDTSYQVCRSASQALDLLQTGLQRSHMSRLTNFGKSSSRGHIVITIHPVLLSRTNSIERFGGMICFVDLASKEKGKKARMTKDSIARDSTMAALMHCFRTMKHNKNIMEGRTSDIGMSDDNSFDGSEISCVSEPKIHQPTMKAVPWRQSKVTMLLQPMFSGSAPFMGDKKCCATASDGTTQVTLLMIAYPGHRDYAEKKSMLCDLEILNGQELQRGIMQRVETGVHQFTIAEGREMTLSYSTSGDDDEDEFRESRQSPMLEKPRRLQLESPPRKIKLESPRPSAPPTIDEEISPIPPPIVPKRTQPSAPVLNDLPGVTLPSEHLESPPGLNPRYKAAPIVKTAMVKSKSTLNIQPPLTELKNSQPSTAERKKNGWMQSSPVKTLSNVMSAGTQAVSVGTKQGKQVLHKLDKITRTMEANHAERKRPEKTKQVSTRMSNEFDVADDVLQTAMSHKLTQLEDQNATLVDRNVKLERKCEKLERENRRLEHALREARRLGRQQQWTQQDEKEFKHSRKMRRKQQDLIQSPLNAHLANVEETYQINNRWLVTNKQHFGLEFPGWWKGAKELDKRDRALHAMERPDLFQSPTQPKLTCNLGGDKRKQDPTLLVGQYQRLKKYA